MRARVYLRKIGRKLTDDNLKAEVRRFKANPPANRSVSKLDIMNALERGDEVRQTSFSLLYT
jgi:hypothetical protein